MNTRIWMAFRAQLELMLLSTVGGPRGSESIGSGGGPDAAIPQLRGPWRPPPAASGSEIGEQVPEPAREDGVAGLVQVQSVPGHRGLQETALRIHQGGALGVQEPTRSPRRWRGPPAPGSSPRPGRHGLPGAMSRGLRRPGPSGRRREGWRPRTADIRDEVLHRPPSRGPGGPPRVHARRVEHTARGACRSKSRRDGGPWRPRVCPRPTVQVGAPRNARSRSKNSSVDEPMKRRRPSSLAPGRRAPTASSVSVPLGLSGGGRVPDQAAGASLQARSPGGRAPVEWERASSREAAGGHARA